MPRPCSALAAAGHATITMTADGASDLGRIFFLSEFATAVAGWALQINPFDQPNVQEAKDNTAKVLEAGSPEDLDDGSLDELLDGLAAPGYLAIMGYLPYLDAVDEAIAGLRAAVIERYGVATTFGYGPRFLHSTGQFHKGGPDTGRFLQLVHDSTEDAEVPGQPYSFRTLIDAQADGDLQTLRGHGLPAVRVRLPAGDLAGAITRMQEQTLDAARLHRPRQDGRQHGPSHPSRLGPPGGRVRLLRGGRRGGRGARRDRRRLARGARRPARGAAHGLGHGAGRRPDAADRRRARRAARSRATRSSTAATPTGTTTCAAPPSSTPRGSTTSTSARPGASGGCRSATA